MNPQYFKDWCLFKYYQRLETETRPDHIKFIVEQIKMLEA